MRTRSIFLSGLFLVSTIIPMDRPIEEESWVKSVGKFLLGIIALKTFLSYIQSSQPESSAQEPFNFGALPQDTQLVIIDLLTRNSYADTLQEAARTVRALTEVNKKLHDLINQPVYCLAIIKHLSARFNDSDEAAAKALSTQAAKERLKLQQPLNFNVHSFVDMSILTENKLDDLIKQGIDLDFTYTDESGGDALAMTLLLKCVQMDQFELAKLLIAKGADVNKGDGLGYTPLMYCTDVVVKTDFIKYLLALPQIKIKQRSEASGGTALETFLIVKTGSLAGESITDQQVIEVLKLYLEDPRYVLTTQEELNFLELVALLHNPEITEIAIKMIKKKHSQ